MRRLAKRALAGLGLQVSRISDTVVMPRPVPGPARSDCPGLDWNAAEVDRILAGPLRDHGRSVAAIPGYDPRNPFFGFTDAAADAVLFIDSSHRGGTGSDVNVLFLEIVPALAPGAALLSWDPGAASAARREGAR